MESPVKGSLGKKNFLIRTWERCRFVPSCGTRKTRKRVAPEGYFPVYVGPEKQRFSVKTKYANHSLFKMLLDDAEIEYGYNTPGPVLLPCDVDLFFKVVAEMEAKETEPHGCGFGSCSPFSPNRRLVNSGEMGKGYGGYGVLTPSRLIRMN